MQTRDYHTSFAPAADDRRKPTAAAISARARRPSYRNESAMKIKPVQMKKTGVMDYREGA